MKLEQAIRQPHFKSYTNKTGINLLYTASWFSTALSRELKPHGISWQQFNIMRILRGQKGKPASLKLVSARMIDRMSNTSRLVDKLVKKGLVSRQASEMDRRQVDITLTHNGERLLEAASVNVNALSDRLFGHLPECELHSLNDLLDALRQCETHEQLASN